MRPPSELLDMHRPPTFWVFANGWQSVHLLGDVRVQDLAERHQQAPLATNPQASASHLPSDRPLDLARLRALVRQQRWALEAHPPLDSGLLPFQSQVSSLVDRGSSTLIDHFLSDSPHPVLKSVRGFFPPLTCTYMEESTAAGCG
jgi:hypothetical protein